MTDPKLLPGKKFDLATYLKSGYGKGAHGGVRDPLRSPAARIEYARRYGQYSQPLTPAQRIEATSPKGDMSRVAKFEADQKARAAEKAQKQQESFKRRQEHRLASVAESGSTREGEAAQGYKERAEGMRVGLADQYFAEHGERLQDTYEVTKEEKAWMAMMSPADLQKHQEYQNGLISAADLTLWKMAEQQHLMFSSPEVYAQFKGYMTAWINEHVDPTSYWSTFDVQANLWDIAFNDITPMPLNFYAGVRDVDVPINENGNVRWGDIPVDEWVRTHPGYFVNADGGISRKDPEKGIIANGDVWTAQDAAGFGIIIGDQFDTDYGEASIRVNVDAKGNVTLTVLKVIGKDSTGDVVSEVEIDAEEYRDRDFTIAQTLPLSEASKYLDIQGGNDEDLYIIQGQRNAEGERVLALVGVITDGWTIKFNEDDTRTYVSSDGTEYDQAGYESLVAAVEAENQALIEEYNGSNLGVVVNEALAKVKDTPYISGLFLMKDEEGHTLARAGYAPEVLDVEAWGTRNTRFTNIDGRDYVEIYNEGAEVWEQYTLPVPYDDPDTLEMLFGSSTLPDFITKQLDDTAHESYFIDLTDPLGVYHFASYYPDAFFELLRQNGETDASTDFLRELEWSNKQIADFFKVNERKFSYTPDTIAYVPWYDIGTRINYTFDQIGGLVQGGLNALEQVPIVGEFAATAGEGVLTALSGLYSTLPRIAAAATVDFIPFVMGDLPASELAWWGDVADEFKSKGPLAMFNPQMQAKVADNPNTPEWLNITFEIAAMMLTPGAGIASRVFRMPSMLKVVKTGNVSFVRSIKTWSDFQAAAAYKGWKAQRTGIKDRWVLYADEKAIPINTLKEADNFFKTGNRLSVADQITMGVTTGQRITFANGETVQLLTLKPANEILDFLAIHYPGRLGGGFLNFIKAKGYKLTNGKISDITRPERLATTDQIMNLTREAIETGAISLDQVFRSINQIKLWGETSANGIGQYYRALLESHFGNIERMLSIKDGIVRKGVKATDKAPLVNGKPSYAWGDVFEYYKYYTIDNPKAAGWIESAHTIIKEVVLEGERHGVVIPNRLLFDFFELAEYFPRGGVIGRQGFRIKGFFGGARFPKGKLSAEKQRVFDYMQDSLAEGFLYDNPRNVFQSFIESMYKRMAYNDAMTLWVKAEIERGAGSATEMGATLIKASEVASKDVINLSKVINEIKLMQKFKNYSPEAGTWGMIKRQYPDFYKQLKKIRKEAKEPEVKAVAEAPVAPKAGGRVQRNLDNAVELHPDNKSWRNYLASKELREESQGWKHYVDGNAHYIVDPQGNIYTFHGFNGQAAFNRIKENPQEWLNEYNQAMQELDAILPRTFSEATVMSAPEASRAITPVIESIDNVAYEAFEKVLAEAEVLLREKAGLKAETKTQRSSAMEAFRHIGFTETTGNRVGLWGSIFDDITINGIRYTGKELEKKWAKTFHTQKPNPLLKFVSDLNRNLVMFQTMDIASVSFIQLIYNLGFDTRNLLKALLGDGTATFTWLESTMYGIANLASPKALQHFARVHQNTLEWAIREGLVTELGGGEFFMRGTLLEKIMEKIPVLGTGPLKIAEVAGRGFGAGSFAGRVLMVEKLQLEWIRAGATKAELVGLANELTGVISTKAIGVGATQRLAESALLFAPRYTRANLMLFSRLMPLGTRFSGIKRGMPAKMLLETIAGTAAGWTSMYVALCLAMGQEPRLKPWPESIGEGAWKGDGSKAFTVEVNGEYIGVLGGFPFSFMRMWGGIGGQAAELIANGKPMAMLSIDFSGLTEAHQSLMQNNPLYKFLTGRSSPGISLVTEMLTGRDYLGYSLEGYDYLEELANKFMPFALQSVTFQDPPSNIQAFVAQLFGLRTFPQSMWELANEKFEELTEQIPNEYLSEEQIVKKNNGTLAWSDLNKWQKETFQQLFPELKEAIDEANAASNLRASDEEKQWRDDIDATEKVRLDANNAAFTELQNPQSPEILTIRDYRIYLSNNSRDFYAVMDDIRRRYPDLYESFEKAWDDKLETAPQFDIAYNEYYDIIFNEKYSLPAGGVDYQSRDAAVAAWTEKWGEDFYDMVQDLKRYGFVGQNPLELKLWEDKDFLSAYWELPEGQARTDFLDSPLNLDYESRLAFWGYITTISPDAEAVVRQWCVDFGVPESKIPALAKFVLPDEMMTKYNITDPGLWRQYTETEGPIDGWDKQYFLKQHPEIYEYLRGEEDISEIQFSLIPEPEEHELILDYEAIEGENATDRRNLWRCTNEAGDAALVKYKGFAPRFGGNWCRNFMSKRGSAEQVSEAEEFFNE